MARTKRPKSGNKTLKRETTDKEVIQFQRTVTDIWLWKRFGIGYHRRYIYRLIKRIECKLAKPYVTHKNQSEEVVR